MRLTKLLLAVSIAAMAPALAQTAHGAGTKAESAVPAMADGEVRKVDKDAKKITLKHGPIKSLDMPAMTMVFQVKDAAFLDKVKQGDKVRFAAEKVGGAYTLTQIEPTK